MNSKKTRILKKEEGQKTSEREEALLKAKELLFEEQKEKTNKAVKKLEDFMVKELPDFILDLKYEIIIRPKN